MCIKDAGETWVCADCIGESFLYALIESNGIEHTCHYCSNTQACFSLKTISDLTEQAITEHYVRTAEEPSELQNAMIRHSENHYEWEREGDDIVLVIEELLETSPVIAGDIQQFLEEEHLDFEAAKMGMESDFSSSSHYEEKGKVETEHLDVMWDKFVNSLKTESRYINHIVRDTLDDIFRDVENLQSRGGKAVIASAGPSTEIPFLYRARWCRSHDELEKMLVTPDRELGPPPYRFSGSNRMSAKGISVFYGASSVETAISEIRPPVGCNVVTAKFNVIRPLRLINLSALESILEHGSKFDPDFIRRREQAAFLRTLTNRIVKPVLPGEEDFNYIPTQVIAEYLADPDLFDLDGILYPSVQLSGTKETDSYNVVLFHKASRVHYQALPERKDCWIRFGYQYSEDEWEPDICVTQTAEVQSNASCTDIAEFTPALRDMRKPALEVDMPSVCVHDIMAARFEYSTQTVSRDRLIHKPVAVSPTVSTSESQDDIPY
ncbi:RES family NAD+ phosphorylase [Klebsiella aerogenes]|uniref:RES family NAD+ phosphorylase n=1 Tax=Klebsiella aerogenes TaxID=548 RepID=UPI003752F61B